MTEYEAFAALYFGVRLRIRGQLVHSVNLPYYESDGETEAATNINSYPYTSTFQADGHAITIGVIGAYDYDSSVNDRIYQITADAPFWAIYKSSLDQVMTRVYDYSDDDNPSNDYVYDIITDDRQSPRILAKGGNAATCSLQLSLSDLWNNCSIANTWTFGGIVTCNIDWCTHRILRNDDGTILRHPLTGVILRDD